MLALAPDQRWKVSRVSRWGPPVQHPTHPMWGPYGVWVPYPPMAPMMQQMQGVAAATKSTRAWDLIVVLEPRAPRASEVTCPIVSQSLETCCAYVGLCRLRKSPRGSSFRSPLHRWCVPSMPSYSRALTVDGLTAMRGEGQSSGLTC